MSPVDFSFAKAKGISYILMPFLDYLKMDGIPAAIYI